MKVYNHDVVFREFPDETTLALNISNCPCHCEGCHSPYLANDEGEELTKDFVDELISKHKGITCVGIMGGDADVEAVMDLADYITRFHDVKVGWYSGRDTLPENFDFTLFDYVKVGHYDAARGPLNSETTNQRMWEVYRKRTTDPETGRMNISVKQVVDITKMFTF